MEPNFQPRMKRKDYEDVDDDFADFAFSSPATKIRRLDAELPPMVIVEEEPEVAAATFDQSLRLPEQSFHRSGGLKIEELPNLEENEERAIVLFKPSSTTPIAHSPSNFSVSLDPRFISGLKNRVLRPSQGNSWNWRVADEDETVIEDESSSSSKGCQAVVPWLPPRFPSTNGDNSLQVDINEMMDAEEMGEAAAMDVEEDGASIQQSNTNEGGSVLLNGLPQWQQQQQQQHHCAILQLPQNITTPIVWYR